MSYEDDYLGVYVNAKTAMRRYPTVALIDYVRVGNAWVLGHQKRWAKAVEEDEFHRFDQALLGHLMAYGLSETARHNGFHASDVYFYNLDVIANVLPGIWDENYSGLPAEYEEIRMKRDAAEGNNWPVLLADVESAFMRASPWARDVLFTAFGLGATTPPGDADAALRELRDLLGGARPQGCPNNCEECGYGQGAEVL